MMDADEPMMVEEKDFGSVIPSLATSSLTIHRQLANGVMEEDEIVFGEDGDGGDGAAAADFMEEPTTGKQDEELLQGLPQQPPELTIESRTKEKEPTKVFKSVKAAQEENVGYELVDCDEDEDEDDGEHEYVYVWEECSTDESVETPPIPEHVTHHHHGGGEELDPSEYDVALEFDASAASSDEMSSSEDENEVDEDKKQDCVLGKQPLHKGEVTDVPPAPPPIDDKKVDLSLADVDGQDGPESPSAPLETAAIAPPNQEGNVEATQPVKDNIVHPERDSLDHVASLAPVTAENGTVSLDTVDPTPASNVQETTKPDAKTNETGLEDDGLVEVNSVDDHSPFQNNDIEMGATSNNMPLHDAPVHQGHGTRGLDHLPNLCSTSTSTRGEQNKVTIKRTPQSSTIWVQKIALIFCFLLAGGATVPIAFYLLKRQK